jgi:hypothetical protein
LKKTFEISVFRQYRSAECLIRFCEFSGREWLGLQLLPNCAGSALIRGPRAPDKFAAEVQVLMASVCGASNTRQAAADSASDELLRQYKCVLDAIKGGRATFVLDGAELSLNASCGAYITMNPGYLGRTALPESLKVRRTFLSAQSAVMAVSVMAVSVMSRPRGVPQGPSDFPLSTAKIARLWSLPLHP